MVANQFNWDASSISAVEFPRMAFWDLHRFLGGTERAFVFAHGTVQSSVADIERVQTWSVVARELIQSTRSFSCRGRGSWTSELVRGVWAVLNLVAYSPRGDASSVTWTAELVTRGRSLRFAIDLVAAICTVLYTIATSSRHALSWKLGIV